MNSSLRLARGGDLPASMTEHLEGNRYVNTIYLCTSSVVKISGASRIPRGRKVYRGMAGVRLPEHFVVAGEDGARGGVEFAFMSTTTSRVRCRPVCAYVVLCSHALKTCLRHRCISSRYSTRE